MRACIPAHTINTVDFRNIPGVGVREFSISHGANRSRAALQPPMCFQCFVLQHLQNSTHTHSHTLNNVTHKCKLLLFYTLFSSALKLSCIRCFFPSTKVTQRVHEFWAKTAAEIKRALVLARRLYYQFKHSPLCYRFSRTRCRVYKIKARTSSSSLSRAHTNARAVSYRKPRLQQVSRQQRARNEPARACLLNIHHLTHTHTYIYMRALTHTHSRLLTVRER